MVYILLKWLLNALVLLLTAYIVPGILIGSLYTALIVAVLLGLVNAVIRPILIILTLPINILTLGLFIFVINGLLFWFLSTIVKGFEVSGFLPAFLGALLVSIFSWLFSQIISNKNIRA